MIFTGKNLELVRRCVELAQGELHNQIATCPDDGEYSDDIDELEKERDQLDRLLDRIDTAVTKEQRR